MHGAGGGAPAGNKNARKHGHHTVDAIMDRRMIAALIRRGRELVEMA